MKKLLLAILLLGFSIYGFTQDVKYGIEVVTISQI
jgi:hypothetical protein